MRPPARLQEGERKFLLNFDRRAGRTLSAIPCGHVPIVGPHVLSFICDKQPFPWIDTMLLAGASNQKILISWNHLIDFDEFRWL